MPLGHPRHHPHHAGPNAHHWIYNSEGNLSLSRVGGLFARLSGELGDQGFVQLADERVTPPDVVHAIVRYERAPHGDFVLKFEVTWDDSTELSPERPIEELLS